MGSVRLMAVPSRKRPVKMKVGQKTPNPLPEESQIMSADPQPQEVGLSSTLVPWVWADIVSCLLLKNRVWKGAHI